MAYFEIELLDKNILKVKAYDSLADKCYRTLVYEDEIYIIGNLELKGEIRIQEIHKIYQRKKLYKIK